MEILDHETALSVVVAALTARQHYVLGAIAGAELATVLERLPTWHVYVDDGRAVLSLSSDSTSAGLFDVIGAIGLRAAVVVLVPKAVPVAKLREALGAGPVLSDVGPQPQHRDLLVLGVGGETRWPVLLVNAITVVDPAAGLSIQAADLARQN